MLPSLPHRRRDARLPAVPRTSAAVSPLLCRRRLIHLRRRQPLGLLLDVGAATWFKCLELDSLRGGCIRSYRPKMCYTFLLRGGLVDAM